MLLLSAAQKAVASECLKPRFTVMPPEETSAEMGRKVKAEIAGICKHFNGVYGDTISLTPFQTRIKLEHLGVGLTCSQCSVRSPLGVTKTSSKRLKPPAWLEYDSIPTRSSDSSETLPSFSRLIFSYKAAVNLYS